ncbi:methylmalonyl-CoA mutase family protein [Aurantimonas sp. VKM B-3413]|uniref:methylmalonyl-CoA mutase family protein n=1 Tax=Aurantimonas sp. VKM B-3413 TaxID=2779401 RepID=UPI001E4BD01C|nr:methylmalonyl-CoA mutase family protein [Aurantimonas sp. VKM B-3413]MCB8838834.1 methylmalonyl-CoA mutase family protein [Aurantimonas sp. VKM B-3413]
MDDEAFPSADEAAWRTLVERSLKGRSFETLSTRAADGFVYGPLYPRMAEASPLAHCSDGPWIIHQRVDDPDAERAGRQARTDLEGGAGALSLCFAGSLAARGFGLSPDADTVAKALEGVALDLVTLRLEPCRDTEAAAEAIAKLVEARGQALPNLAIDLCHDPLGVAAFTGHLSGDGASVRSAAAQHFRRWREIGFSGRLAEADARIFHDAGATAGQELGAVLAAAVEHLRSGEAAGWSVAEAAAAIGFTLSVDQTQFEQIAKLRALRLLWARVLEACGEARPAPARIHAETSFRMMAAMDPHTNVLRATIAAFSAGAAGADSLTVLPHTLALGLADPAARRLARNVQVILQEETGLARVLDPAAGSGAIETLTELTAEVAWSEFQKIEAEGGLAASLVSGALQSRIADARLAAEHRLEAGQPPIVGTNLYPPKDERSHPLLEAEPVVETTTGGGGVSLEPLRPCRLAASLETAR